MAETAEFLDRLKELGFHYATMGGLSVGLDDVEIPQEKGELIGQAQAETEQVQRQYEEGVITDGERYNKTIDIWTHTTAEVAEVMFTRLRLSRDGFNPIFMMADSGARGSKEQIRQLAGMRGLMAKPQKAMTGQKGEIIESPITANFKEGLSVLEYFISTHGARKGLADTALKTADAGYLTRRLVDVAQDVIIREYDCNTLRGIFVEAIKEGEEITEQLYERIIGRVLAEPVIDPATGEKILDANTLVDEKSASVITGAGVERVRIRSVLTCETGNGVCAMCYGTNMASGRLVDLGEAVGVIAAQSIGEPGTQLTLRTFHIGGTAARIAAESRVETRSDGRADFENVEFIRQEDGHMVCVRRNGIVKVVDDNNRIVAKYNVPYGAKLYVADNQVVQRGDILFEWDPYADSIIVAAGGIVHFVDVKDDQTCHEQVDETTGMRQRVIIESKNRKLNPHIVILDDGGRKVGSYMLPVGAHLLVSDGDKARAGDALAKMPKETSRTKDITGGLPRVTELFEARRPKEPAIISEIEGTVRFGAVKRGVREVLVTSLDGKTEKRYVIPYGKHILVHDGDHIQAGERLSEGSIAPHDILAILGPAKVQEYLVREIQDVYRLQGVRINDKHIEVIVRQMLQKVRIEDPSDTAYLEGDHVDGLRFIRENEKMLGRMVIEDPGDATWKAGYIVERVDFNRENRRLRAAGKTEAQARPARPAVSMPLLLGITQASLSTDSFISAASFQETTRVLTDAAIEKRVDVLSGLKENVIMGHLIPAGTGLQRYKKLRVVRPAEEEEELAKDWKITPPISVPSISEEEIFLSDKLEGTGT
jgi:DNA-directed RNA polymerase subunit beta'